MSNIDLPHSQENKILYLGIEQLSPNPHQPRKQFKPEKLAELAETIREYGILQPIVVKQCGMQDYIIIAGERRWRAAQLAELRQVKCIVMEVEDKTVAAMALIENLQREALNPIEEANALQQYMIEFDCTQEELAKKLGCSRGKVAHSLRLIKCHPRIKQYLIEGLLTEGHAKVLVTLSEMEQYALGEQCVKEAWSVRQLERAMRSYLKKDKGLPLSQHKKKNDPDLQALLTRISEHFGTEVQLQQDNEQKKSGWLKIRYFDYDILDGIFHKIGIQ